MEDTAEKCFIIPLTKGKESVIDYEMKDSISKHKWYYHNGYAVRKSKKSDGLNRRISIYMHREIMGDICGLEIDHINGDTLDNRKSNLRHATHQQNIWNGKNRNIGTSAYKGVFINKNKRWRAQIIYNYTPIHIGVFDSEVDAARAYNDKAKELFGEFARINITEGF